MLIREMTMDDYPAAYELWTEIEGWDLGKPIPGKPLPPFWTEIRGTALFASSTSNWSGRFYAAMMADAVFLYHVAVSKHYRNRGIGRQLVDRALRSLKAAGITKCHLMVYADNLAGCRFWEKTGWLKRSDIILFSTLT